MAQGMLRPLAILFDLDETLTDRPRSLEAWAGRFAADFAGRIGSPPVADLVALVHAKDRHGYRPREHMLADLLAALPWTSAPTVDDLLAYWDATFPACCVASDGAHDALARLRAGGLRLGLVTNGGAAMQAAKIAALRLAPALDAIIVSAAVGVAKPDPRIFRLATDALGVAPERAWFVGDHPVNDIGGAAGAGLTPVWLRGVRPWPRGRPRPTLQIQALEELVTLVRAELP
jgi:putative hydrolase of the HAD superfamily